MPNSTSHLTSLSILLLFPLHYAVSLAVGASAGRRQALSTLLAALSADFPALLIIVLARRQ